MRVEEFSMLVDEHARCWHTVGEASPQVIYDPSYRYHLECAREESRKLVEAFRAALTVDGAK